MNYYGPKQRASDGRWHFCCENNGLIYPVGLCSPFRDCRCQMLEPDCELCHGKGVIEVENPCPGHDTEAGAVDHYHRFLVQTARTEDLGSQVLKRCEHVNCKEFTNQVLSWGPGFMSMKFLCPRHMNRELHIPRTPGFMSSC